MGAQVGELKRARKRQSNPGDARAAMRRKEARRRRQSIAALPELGALWRMRRPAEAITFVTCTDGNHGQAVAWAAKHLGTRTALLLPGQGCKGTH